MHFIQFCLQDVLSQVLCCSNANDPCDSVLQLFLYVLILKILKSLLDLHSHHCVDDCNSDSYYCNL